MKTLKKRISALYIDSFIIGSVFVLLFGANVPPWFVIITLEIGIFKFGLPSIGMLCIILALMFKDFVFKNASIGKKMMGLIILDKAFDVPSAKTMIKRGALMYTWGFVMFAYCKVVSDMRFEDWELDFFGTRVVDKKRFENDRENYIAEMLSNNKP